VKTSTRYLALALIAPTSGLGAFANAAVVTTVVIFGFNFLALAQVVFACARAVALAFVAVVPLVFM
jgi:hypothetical protein